MGTDSVTGTDIIENKPARPTQIVVCCILIIIGLLTTIPMIISHIQNYSQIENWYLPYLGFTIAVGLICVAGLWKMKKWAAYSYSIYAVLNQIFLMIIGTWTLMAVFVPAIVVALALSQVKKMH